MIPMAGRNKHRKPKESSRRNKVAAGVVIGGTGVAMVPVSAVAAPVSSWDKIAQCESSGSWNRPDGDFGKSSGGLQFQPASWSAALAYLRSKGVDTSGFPQGPGHQAYRATKQQQIMAGEALLALQGPGAWTCNAKTGYPLASSGSNGSMFEGGARPYGPASTYKKAVPVPVHPVPVQPFKPVKPKYKVSGDGYTVVAGDTLYDITRKHSPERPPDWRKLYEANKRVIGANPDLIYPGQVFTLPFRAAEEETAMPYIWVANVAIGKTNNSVKIVQRALNKELPGSVPKATGFYGEQTIAAVRSLQVRLYGKGPAADGKIGIQTLRFLGKKYKFDVKSVPFTPSSKPSPRVASPFKPGSKFYVSQAWGVRNARYAAGRHTGRDYAAASGTPVVAVRDGVVSRAAEGAAYGIHIRLRANNGRDYVYCHLSGIARTGTVKAGTVIGYVGNTGTSSGAHLHLEDRPHGGGYGSDRNPTW